MKRTVGLMLVGALAFAGCGSDDKDAADDGTATPTGPAVITGLDATFGKAGVVTTALSAADGDRLLSVTVGKDGKVYGVGFVATAGDQAMAVARLEADGSLDTTFSGDGFATVNVAPGGKAGETSRGVAVQSNGKVVIAGAFEHDPTAEGDAARDTDFAITRFDAAGALDATFGDGGTTKVDVGTGKFLPPAAGSTATTTSLVGDSAYGLTVLPDDRLLVVGASPAKGEGRTDADFAVLMFTANGQLDTTFATGGILTVDVEGGHESPRQAVIQPDGKIVFSGYTRNTATPPVVRPALVRISADGTLDTTFGKGGIGGDVILAPLGEAYDVAMQGDKFVTVGYGRSADVEKVDMLAARFTSTGALDTTFGTNGLVRIDIAGDDDRGRDVVVLPDGRILIAGSAKPDATNINAALYLLDEDGARHASFGTNGVLQVDLGGPSDAFFGVALTPDGENAMVVGYKGADPTTGDDAVVARVALSAA